ncbi:MAG TPA: ISKra4 family transposase [Desulfocapsa sulfexigens]|nr:ISKra4 family transposase [Desulfocapsa sulfexigens]
MAKIVAQKGRKLSVQVDIDLTGSLLEIENRILDACNEVGCLATEEALKLFDTDGSPIKLGETQLTSRCQSNKTYQTPYGSVDVERHVYQSSQGGRIYCPLEQKANIIRGATPRFAQQISHKYSTMNAPSVCRDLAENHHRQIAHSYLQDVSEWVGSIAQAKEEIWEYDTPELNSAISTIVISLDGAYVLMREEGYREAMVGNISLYDLAGKRQHTIYLGEAPEYGKGTFLHRMETEISKVKKRYPDALYLGIADGASHNWTFLEKHTSTQLLDFFHVTEYLAKVSYAAYPKKGDKVKREEWLHEHCSELKNDKHSVESHIREMEKLSQKTSLTKTIKENLSGALTYFKNHRTMMDYSEQIEKNLPIGSGVTEAACKTLVKQRLCGSGMRWKEKGMKVVLSLRALVQSKGRWQQFWDNINQFGTQNCF